jgi:hypothetical protein
MPFIYIVRCNFTDPAKEAAWNAWYSGPKIAQMLTKPLFRGCQRFRRETGTGRDYLALWTVQAPEAFTTEEYRADWGFSEWEPLIKDWSRDLFDARAHSEDTFVAAPAGGLHVISFDGLGVDEALATRAVMTLPPEMLWLSVVGLDRHTPLIGLQLLSDRPGASLTASDPPGVQQAVYRPISELYQRAADPLDG